MDVHRLMIALKHRLLKAWLVLGVGLVAAGLVMFYAWLTNQTGLPTFERRGFVASAIVNLVLGGFLTAATWACMRSRRWGRVALEYTSWLLAAAAVAGAVWVFAGNGLSDCPLFIKVAMVTADLGLSTFSGFVLHLDPVEPRQNRGFPVIMSAKGQK